MAKPTARARKLVAPVADAVSRATQAAPPVVPADVQKSPTSAHDSGLPQVTDRLMAEERDLLAAIDAAFMRGDYLPPALTDLARAYSLAIRQPGAKR
jgi:hypothetical protein